jgi:hypothetical protein
VCPSPRGREGQGPGIEAVRPHPVDRRKHKI